MSSQDDSFVALGPTNTGFMTHGSRIDVGADLFGNALGILGKSESGVAIHGDSTNSTGVQGDSQSGYGMHGESETGIGVFGRGFTNRGAVFQSGNSSVPDGHPVPVTNGPVVPQLQLVPQVMNGVPEQVPLDPGQVTMVNPAEVLPRLPAIAHGGDLVVTMDGESLNCILWFCVQEGGSQQYPANWCQVLLGKAIPGQG